MKNRKRRNKKKVSYGTDEKQIINGGKGQNRRKMKGKRGTQMGKIMNARKMEVKEIPDKEWERENGRDSTAECDERKRYREAREERRGERGHEKEANEKK